MPGVGSLAYDARNRIVGTGGLPTRGYDPANRKLWWRDPVSNCLCIDFWLPTGEKLVTYRIDEYVYPQGNWDIGYMQFKPVARNLWFAGRLVRFPSGATEWPDRLSSNARHHPYGEERGTSSTEYKFATYQREASGLDYALNRYYSSVYGRFLSSDPYRASGGPSDPGSWNRYAYVQGDPVNLFDPQGLQSESPEGPPPLTFCQTFPTHPDCQINGPGNRVPPQPAYRRLSVDQIRSILSAHSAAAQRPGGNDCQETVGALAEIAQQTDDGTQLVTAVNQLFTTTQDIRIAGVTVMTVPTGGGTESLIRIESTVSGFATQYQEGDQNQSHHFAFYFNLGYRLVSLGFANPTGLIQGVATAIEFNNGFTNLGDIRLGEYAGWAGILLGQILGGLVQPLDHTAITSVLSGMCK